MITTVTLNPMIHKNLLDGGGYEPPTLRSESLSVECGFAESNYVSINPWDEDEDGPVTF